MNRPFWWISTGIMLVLFLPVGILLLGITILKEIQNFNNQTEEIKVEEDIVENEYFENTLERPSIFVGEPRKTNWTLF